MKPTQNWCATAGENDNMHTSIVNFFFTLNKNNNRKHFYRLIGPPKTYFLSSLLINGEVPIYKNLYETNMDGEKSFYPHSKGIEYLLNESKVAFMETGDVIRSVNKVKTIWIPFGIPLHWDMMEMTAQLGRSLVEMDFIK